MSVSNSEALRQWQRLAKEIKNINQGIFNYGFRNLTAVRIASDGRLVLGVPDDFFGGWIGENYGDVIEDAGVKAGISGCVFEPGHPLNEGQPDPSEPLAVSETYETATLIELPPDSPTSLSVPAPAPAPSVPSSSAITATEPDVTEADRPHAENCLITHTFENFVVGEENRGAYIASKMVAETPGTYNPLYIYGGTGVGKTHLLHAVAHYVRKNHPAAVVRYTPCEELINDFYNLLQQKKNLSEFRSSLRDVDFLLVDDIHSLGKKPQLQEEFFNMFNSLQNQGKQIILTSDKQPCEIEGLEARLISRFESGMTTDIAAPEFEARFAILKMMREESAIKVKLDDAVLEFIASNISSSVRRLKGAFIRVTAYVSIRNEKRITIPEVEKILQLILNREAAATTVSIEEIQRQVAAHFNLKLSDLLGERRPKNIAEPRKIAMYLCRKHTTHSLPEIGQAFGRNHATILSAYNKIREQSESSEDLRRDLTAIEHAFGRC